MCTHGQACTRSIAYIRICTPACTWILCKRNVHRVKRRGKLHGWRREAYAPIPAKQRNPLHFVSTLYADHPASLSSRGTFPPPFFSHSTPRYVNSLPPGCLSGRARSRGFSLSSLCYLHTFFSVDNRIRSILEYSIPSRFTYISSPS